MKKLIYVLLLVLLITIPLSTVYADKPTTYITVTDVEFSLRTNVRSDASGETLYYPAELVGTIHAYTEDGGRRQVTNVEFLGNSQTTPCTPKQIHSALPSDLKKMYKELHQEAINIDPSE